MIDIYFHSSVVEDFMESPCIMIGMAVGDDYSRNECCRNTDLVYVIACKWRRVDHDSFAVDPENIPGSGSLGVESM
jgi:hypothetical protein